MPQKQLHADAADNGGATTTTKTKKRYTPDADSDFLTVSKKVRDAWAGNPLITLIWTNQAAFNTMVNNYEAFLGTRKSDGSFRPSETQTLGQLDTQINTAVSEVKTYIEYKFKKPNAVAQYARYGIVKENGTYILPRDKDDRKLSLPLMITAIAADGFGAEKYGTAFWTAMKTDYDAALKAASDTDGDVSGGAANKNQYKKQVAKVMNALRLVLKGNYPDTYKAVYRQWGWQKEDY